MRAFIINLDSAQDRLAAVEDEVSRSGLQLCRVPAVDGARVPLPNPNYAARRFQWFHGRGTNPREIGCYFSHIAACKAFLETDDKHALIGEDDIRFKEGFHDVLQAALAYSDSWNILRLSGLSTGASARVAPLSAGYSLCVALGRLKGAGAYVVDRSAARAFVEWLLPMWLPFDHAFDREWFFDLRAATIQPFPVSQQESGFRSSIQGSATGKLPFFYRRFTTHPYQACNEVARWVFRTTSFVRMKVAVSAKPLARSD